MSTKNKLLVALAALAFVVGVLDYGPVKGSQLAVPVLMVHAVASVGLIVAWFFLDAGERAYKASAGLKAAIAGLTVFALPYYLFRSRGLKSGGQALATSLLLFLATMTAYRSGAWVAYQLFG